MNSVQKFEDILSRDGYLIYRIKGDSMMPLINQKTDLVMIKKLDRPCKKYDIALYKRDSGQYVLHRILRKRRQDYVICGDNRWKVEYDITDRHILGVMTELIRNGKTMPLDNWHYKAYVHLWCDFFMIRATILWFRALPHRVKRALCRMRKADASNGENGIR